MTTVLTDPTNLQGLYEHVKFITGQSNLKFKDFVRMTNFAMDDYSSIVLSIDGRWKFDDSTNTDTPIGSTTIVSGQRAYTLDTNFLTINKVEIEIDSVRSVIKPIDQRDFKDEALEQSYQGTGLPRYYDYDGQQIKLYPAPTSGTLYVDFSRPTTYFATTDSNATVGIPRIHHRYLALKVAKEVMVAQNDPSITKIEQELIAWEGQEVQGRLSGGKIRDYFSKRDENTPRQLKPKLDPTFSQRAHDKGINKYNV